MLNVEIEVTEEGRARMLSFHSLEQIESCGFLESLRTEVLIVTETSLLNFSDSVSEGASVSGIDVRTRSSADSSNSSAKSRAAGMFWRL